MNTRIQTLLITWWTTFLTREFTTINLNKNLIILFVIIFNKKYIHTYDYMDLSYYIYYCKEYVSDLVYTVHKYPNNYHCNLIFSNKVLGIYLEDIHCPFQILKHIYYNY